MEITVQIKSIYGNQHIYPACEKAEIFCKLVRQKTLTENDVKNIKALGYTVNVKANHPTTL